MGTLLGLISTAWAALKAAPALVDLFKVLLGIIHEAVKAHHAAQSAKVRDDDIAAGYNSVKRVLESNTEFIRKRPTADGALRLSNGGDVREQLGEGSIPGNSGQGPSDSAVADKVM